MKNGKRLALISILILALASVAAAQAPTPVVRMGDWVEIGNEVWMNIIATADIRYRTVHNLDFEDDVQDRAASRNPVSSLGHDQEADHVRAEIRFGADFRYQKNLRLRVLFETQSTFDGNLIDDRSNSTNPVAVDAFGRAASGEDNSPHVERFWIDYKFPGTPIRMRVGSDLWFSDPAGLLGDDDPRFAIYADLDALEIGAWAVIQSESQRIGLTNDNDFTYYVFHMRYKGMKPYEFGLDVAYFRERFNGAVGQGAGTLGQNHDTVLIMPSWTGTMGPISALLQFNVVLGSAESNDATGNADYDVFAWALVGYVEANLGMVRPWIGLFWGSGDDDTTDRDLEGFNTLPQREISLINATRWFGHLTTTFGLGNRDVVPPARSGCCGGSEYGHTTGNPFNDRIGNAGHTIGGVSAINSAYSNPGTLAIPVGLKIFPVKGHRVDVLYIYRGMTDSALVDAALGVNVSDSMYHEVGLIYTWTVNSHFDIRLAGHIAIPADGTEDIARTVAACGPTGLTACSGEDPAMQAEARFRARF